MILASVDGFFQFLPKLVEEKVSSGTEKTGKNHGKNHPLEETANPDNNASCSQFWLVLATVYNIKYNFIFIFFPTYLQNFSKKNP